MHLFKKSRINNPSKNTVTNFCHFIAVLSSFRIKNQSFVLSYPHNSKYDKSRLESRYLFFFISHLCVFDAFLTYILYKKHAFWHRFLYFTFQFLCYTFCFTWNICFFIFLCNYFTRNIAFTLFCSTIVPLETLLPPCFTLQLFHVKHFTLFVFLSFFKSFFVSRETFCCFAEFLVFLCRFQDFIVFFFILTRYIDILS